MAQSQGAPPRSSFYGPELPGDKPLDEAMGDYFAVSSHAPYGSVQIPANSGVPVSVSNRNNKRRSLTLVNNNPIGGTTVYIGFDGNVIPGGNPGQLQAGLPLSPGETVSITGYVGDVFVAHPAATATASDVRFAEFDS